MKKKALLVVAFATAFACVLWAADAARELNAAAQVMQSMKASNEIPASLLSSAQCIAVIPKLTKGGLIVGGQHGTGVVSCRTGSKWSPPAFITMTGGSIGLQAGAEHQDIVLLMNSQGQQELMSGHWDLGAEAVAAGPTGANAGKGANTGWKAPVLSYARTSGAYAGANLQGSKIGADQDMIHNIYGTDATFDKILSGKTKTPDVAKEFMAALPPGHSAEQNAQR